MNNPAEFIIIAGENPKGNKEIWESRERCRLLSLRNKNFPLPLSYSSLINSFFWVSIHNL